MPRNRTVRFAVLGSSVQRAAPYGFPSSRSSAIRRRIVVGLLVLLSLVLITLSFRSSALDGIQGDGATALRPFETAANRVARPFRDTIGWFHGLVNARSENKKLRVQIAGLQQELIQDEGAVQQNAQLTQELNYQAPPSVRAYGQVRAEVLANPLSSTEDSITISAGSVNGLQTGDVVVEPTGNPDGTGALIGTVDRVTSHVSRVMLLTDDDSAVTATDLTDSNVIGSVRPGGSSLILDRVPKEPNVRRGDTIITAGSLGDGPLKSRYPRGIPIGTVTSVTNSDADLFQNIQLQSLVDLSSIRSVIVLTPPSNR
ncbi:MAG TPA: rod shape-determining protein MreC [Gaiellaceae bacterium]|nr:rod shape-determining protein MreC [Gaiellaceae bacterium]